MGWGCAAFYGHASSVREIADSPSGAFGETRTAPTSKLICKSSSGVRSLTQCSQMTMPTPYKGDVQTRGLKKPSSNFIAYATVKNSFE